LITIRDSGVFRVACAALAVLVSVGPTRFVIKA
jgi:hypothetical protein